MTRTASPFPSTCTNAAPRTSTSVKSEWPDRLWGYSIGDQPEVSFCIQALVADGLRVGPWGLHLGGSGALEPPDLPQSYGNIGSARTMAGGAERYRMKRYAAATGGVILCLRSPSSTRRQREVVPIVEAAGVQDAAMSGRIQQGVARKASGSGSDRWSFATCSARIVSQSPAQERRNGERSLPD